MGCDQACTDNAGKARVDAWMKVTCGGNDQVSTPDPTTHGNSTAATPTPIIPDINPSDIPDNSTQNAAAQATKVRDW